jgi:hypothetical protein
MSVLMHIQSIRSGSAVVCVQMRDIYSAGMVMFHAMTGCWPFHGAGHYLVNRLAKVNRERYGSVLPLPLGTPNELETFLKSCWQQEVDEREFWLKARQVCMQSDVRDEHPQILPTLTEFTRFAVAPSAAKDKSISYSAPQVAIVW